MSMRDKIVSILAPRFCGTYCALGAADAIIKALPDYDAQQARIKELERELSHCIYEIERDGSRKSSMVRRAAFAREALKGEET
jgi:hypothetical protein